MSKVSPGLPATISVAFALDALGADPPHPSIQETPLADNQAISHALDELAQNHQQGL